MKSSDTSTCRFAPPSDNEIRAAALRSGETVAAALKLISPENMTISDWSMCQDTLLQLRDGSFLFCMKSLLRSAKMNPEGWFQPLEPVLSPLDISPENFYITRTTGFAFALLEPDEIGRLIDWCLDMSQYDTYFDSITWSRIICTLEKMRSVALEQR